MKFKMTLAGSLRVQFDLGRLASFATSFLIWSVLGLMGYRIKGLAQIRAKCSEEFKRHRGPWIICSNHLTMVDSVILAYGLQPLYKYIADFGLLPWNLPEQKNFNRNVLLRLMCYLCKCIPVKRGGDREEMRENLEKCNWVLSEGQSLMIFPEGGRTRTGRVDRERVSYGVGRFVKDFENCKVMCIYLRGEHQESYSTVPRFGERFTMSVETWSPERVGFNGLRAQRFYAEQIIDRIARMEEEYFALHRQRHSGPDGPGEPAQGHRCTLH